MGVIENLRNRFNPPEKERVDVEYPNGIKMKYFKDSTEIIVPKKMGLNMPGVGVSTTKDGKKKFDITLRTHGTGTMYNNNQITIVGDAQNSYLRSGTSRKDKEFRIRVPKDVKFYCSADKMVNMSSGGAVQYASERNIRIDKQRFHGMLASLGSAKFFDYLPSREEIRIPIEMETDLIFGQDEKGKKYIEFFGEKAATLNFSEMERTDKFLIVKPTILQKYGGFIENKNIQEFVNDWTAERNKVKTDEIMKDVADDINTGRLGIGDTIEVEPFKMSYKKRESLAEKTPKKLHVQELGKDNNER